MNMNTESMKDRLVAKLVFNLEELVKYYRQFLDLARKEKELLLNSQDLESLTENNHQKETLITKIKSMDALRFRYAQELCVYLKIDSESPRLLEIAKYVSAAESERLRNLHSALDIVINRLVVINAENEKLAQSGLKFINGAVDTLKSALGGKKTYEKKGGYKVGPDQAGHFVNKQT